MSEDKKYRVSQGLNIMEIGGDRYSVYIEVKQKNYVIGENEYRLIKAIEGDKSWTDICRSCPEYSREQIDRLTEIFLGMGVLIQESEREEEKKRLFRVGIFRYKLKLISGNSLVPGKSWRSQALSFILLYASLPAFAFGLWIWRDNAEELLRPTLYLQCPFYLYLILFFLITVLHEFAHLIVTRNLGISVPDMGLMIYGIYPVAYTNISFSRLLPRRIDRMKCLFAGVLMNCLLGGLSLIIGSFLQNTARSFFAVNAMLNILLAVANLIVFFKLDGYFVLQDLLGIPHLYERSLEEIAQFVRLFLMRSMRKDGRTISRIKPGIRVRQEHVAEEEKAFFYIYGLLCMLYIPMIVLSVAVALIP